MRDTTSIRFFSFLAVLALALIAWPFIGVQSPPLADYPNHMARFHVLQNLETSEALQSFYFIRDGFYPYLSIAAFMKIFSPIFGVEGAGRIFAVFAIYLPVLGTLTLSRANNGKVSWLTLAMVPLALSTVAGWGFLNFLFSTGLVLIFFALWIKTESWPLIRRTVIFAVLIFAVTAMHLISAVFFGLLMGFWELSAVYARRKIERADFVKFLSIAVMYIPAGLLFLTQLGGEIGGSETIYGNFGNKVIVMQSLFSMFGQKPEVILGLPILVGLILLRSQKVISIHPRFIFVGFALLIVGLIAPFQLFGVAFIGIRFPLLALAVFIAGVEEVDFKKARMAAGILAILIAGKLFVLKDTFKFADRQTGELRAAMQTLPIGSKILPILNIDTALDSRLSPQHYFHRPAYFMIDRDGLIPYFFSMFNVGILEEHSAYTAEWGSPIKIKDFDTDRAFWFADNWRQDFDYVVVMDPSGAEFTHEDMTLLIKNDEFSILEVTPNNP